MWDTETQRAGVPNNTLLLKWEREEDEGKTAKGNWSIMVFHCSWRKV